MGTSFLPYWAARSVLRRWLGNSLKHESVITQNLQPAYETKPGSPLGGMASSRRSKVCYSIGLRLHGRNARLSSPCSTPPCSLGFLSCAEPALADFIHLNSRVRFLGLHMINSSTTASGISLYRALGRWRVCGRGCM